MFDVDWIFVFEKKLSKLLVFILIEERSDLNLFYLRGVACDIVGWQEAIKTTSNCGLKPRGFF